MKEQVIDVYMSTRTCDSVWQRGRGVCGECVVCAYKCGASRVTCQDDGNMQPSPKV